MVYICSRGHNGLQRTCHECASATTLNSGISRRRDSPGNSQGTACPWTGTAAGGTGEAVWAQSGPRPGSPAPVGERRARSFLSSSGHSCGGVVTGRDRGSFLDPDNSRDRGAQAVGPEDDGVGLSQGGGGSRSDRRRSRPDALRRAELGISRESIYPGWATEDAPYHQDAPLSRLAISPGRVCSVELQERVSSRPPANPRRMSPSKRSSGSRDFDSASSGLWQEYSFLCASGTQQDIGLGFSRPDRIGLQPIRVSTALAYPAVISSTGAFFQLGPVCVAASTGSVSVFLPHPRTAGGSVPALWRRDASGCELNHLHLRFSPLNSAARPATLKQKGRIYDN
jgi:hypothetical protein